MVGQRTLTPSIGVRVPVSQPTKIGSLAQLDSATDFYSVGRGFESLRNRQISWLELNTLTRRVKCNFDAEHVI